MRYFLTIILMLISIELLSQQYLFFDKNNSGLSSNKITTIKQDCSNNYYIVTEAEYINQIKISSGYLHKFSKGNWTKIDRLGDLSLEDKVNDVTIDKYNNVLIATSLGFAVMQGNSSFLYDINNSPLPDNNIFKIAVDSCNTYYLGIPNYGIWVKNNENWSYFNYQNSFNGIEDFNFIYVDSKNFVWVGTDYYGLYVYDGINWYKKIDNYYNGKRCYIMGLTENSSGFKYATVQTEDGKHFIAKEDNSIFTFIELNDSTHPFEFFAYNSIIADKKDNLYIGTSNGMFMFNQINFTVFDSTNFNLPANYFVSGFVDINNNKLFGIENFNQHKAFGLLIYNEDGVDISKNEKVEQVNWEYFLSQNYPNPFNPSTTIIYQIPKGCDVLLKIYDVLGREVSTLVNEYKAVGKYTVNFNASDFTSGVYFYRLVAGEYATVKKLMLLK